MKLFKRIKAEHAVNPLESMIPGMVTYVPKPLDPVEMDTLSFPAAEGTGITAKHQIPYDVAGSTLFNTANMSLLDKLKSAALPKGTVVQNLPKSSIVDTYLDFPNPAKAGSIDGVWQAKLVAVEKDAYTGQYRVALAVQKGHNAGQTLTVCLGDTLSVNVKVNF